MPTVRRPRLRKGGQSLPANSRVHTGSRRYRRRGRGRVGGAETALTEFDREAEHLDFAVAWVLGADDHFLVLDLRVREDLRQGHDAVARHAGSVELVDPVSAGSILKAFLDCRIHRLPIVDAIVIAAEIRVPAQLGCADSVEQAPRSTVRLQPRRRQCGTSRRARRSHGHCRRGAVARRSRDNSRRESPAY